MQSVNHFSLGRADAFELAEQAVGAARSAGDLKALAYAYEALAHCLVFSGRLTEARGVVLDLCRLGEQHDENALVIALWQLSLIEYRAGAWDIAREHGERMRRLAAGFSSRDAGGDVKALSLLLVAAASGDSLTVSAAERALESTDARQIWMRGVFRSVVAVSAYWSGDPLRASDLFATNAAEERASGTPSVLRWVFCAEEIEALLALGRMDDALAVLEPWEDETRRLGFAWPLAEATRCRGFLASARGDVEGATTLFERAVEEHTAVGDPFGRARRSSHSGRCTGELAGNALRATRSKRRSWASTSSARRSGRRGHARSSAASAAARAPRA